MQFLISCAAVICELGVLLKLACCVSCLHVIASLAVVSQLLCACLWRRSSPSHLTSRVHSSLQGWTGIILSLLRDHPLSCCQAMTPVRSASHLVFVLHAQSQRVWQCMIQEHWPRYHHLTKRRPVSSCCGCVLLHNRSQCIESAVFSDTSPTGLQA